MNIKPNIDQEENPYGAATTYCVQVSEQLHNISILKLMKLVLCLGLLFCLFVSIGIFINMGLF